jgi:hypothetical protein
MQHLHIVSISKFTISLLAKESGNRVKYRWLLLPKRKESAKFIGGY